MSDIEKISKFKIEGLSGENYFQSLLEQARMLGMLSESELQRIQLECLSLLAKQIEKYNDDRSSSIPVETAQKLLESIMFTIGVGLKNYNDIDDAFVVVKNDDIEKLYEDGYKRINRLVKTTKMLHHSILKNLLQTENVFYHATIVDGIKGFFKLYYPQFAAQEIHITADYPVYNVGERLLGIEFIRRYLECIYYENLFCTLFAAEDVHRLLLGFDENYEQLLFNIYESVLLSSIGGILSQRDFRKLDMTSSSITILKKLFCRKTRTEIEEILFVAVDQLSEIMELPEPLKQYISCSLSQLGVTIENAVKLQTLERVFVIPKYPKNNSKCVFSFGDKLEDEKYRKLVEELMQCRYFSDKKALIKSEIHSIDDLADILLHAEFSEEEMLDFFGELDASEIAALIKVYNLAGTLDEYGISEDQITISRSLQKFFDTLSLRQQNLIKQLIDMINI